MTLTSRQDLVKQICAQIRKQYDSSSGFLFALVDGFSATGKSGLADEISSILRNANYSVETLSTDDFIRYNREDRKTKIPNNQNHRDWYDLERLTALLNFVKNSFPVDVVLYDLYDHMSGLRNAHRRLSIRKGLIVIIEGMYALQIKMVPAYKLVLLARHEELQRRTVERALIRGVSETTERELYWLHNGYVYQHLLANVIMEADYIVDTTDVALPHVIFSAEEQQGVFNWDVLDEFMPHLANGNG